MIKHPKNANVETIFIFSSTCVEWCLVLSCSGVSISGMKKDGTLGICTILYTALLKEHEKEGSGHKLAGARWQLLFTGELHHLKGYTCKEFCAHFLHLDFEILALSWQKSPYCIN